MTDRPAVRDTLRVLLLEDSDADALSILHRLAQAGFKVDSTRVVDANAFGRALDPSLDVILVDFNLPGFNAFGALEVLNSRGIDVPLIVVSGTMGEDIAVRVLQCGAVDYLMKDRLTRLGVAVERAVTARRLQCEKRRIEDALRASEQQARFAMEAARVGTWEIHLVSGAARWSEMLETIHGLEPGTLKGTLSAFLDCIHPGDRATVETCFDQAARIGGEPHARYRVRWPDASEHWMVLTGKTLGDETGGVARAAGIVLDVTEQHRLEEQYRQAQKVDSIGQLAGGIAHDFNNVLTAIYGFCGLLREDVGPDSPFGPDLEEIAKATERAASLTRQLLAFSRRQILEPKVIDLRDTVRNMQAMVERLLGEDLSFTVRLSTQPSRVKADPGQIEQVILNLLLNARDAMPDGGDIVLEVTTIELDALDASLRDGIPPGSYVRLSITDTGRGMDSATRERIFEPFFTTKGLGRGTGLGLSTVYGIVKQSGGDIEVRSAPGQGATFHVWLPRVDDTVDVDTGPAVGMPSELRGSETVLVVEDDGRVRDLTRRILSERGYRVMTAPTPSEALHLVTELNEPVHLLISDVVLPEMSGRALADLMMGTRPQLKLLYMSGYTDDAVVQRGVLAQEAAFIQKPFTPDALARKVRAVLG